MKKVNKTLKENKELKETLNTVMASLKEAAVTNHNLAQIIKLISENSTTKEEKEEIIRKFANEAKTIDASKTLYESISNDLKKAKKMNITEDKNLSVESSKKINETPIYKSQDIMESLDLMHRMMR
jgi:Asp-tRNA(Asn)/Glu-tRNA(Gln) amidotransferase B subunit